MGWEKLEARRPCRSWLSSRKQARRAGGATRVRRKEQWHSILQDCATERRHSSLGTWENGHT